MVSLDGFGNLICFEINVLGRKNAVITYDSTILSGCKILQMHYHTRSALSLLVSRIVENLITKESNNLAAQTYLLIDYVTNSYQEKNIFPTFSLPEEIQGANCSA